MVEAAAQGAGAEMVTWRTLLPIPPPVDQRRFIRIESNCSDAVVVALLPPSEIGGPAE